ncbi:putative N6-adenine-specific DNA methylase [Dethiosulfatibacter aminovorans DSM 17477]|uniref:Putative N6-adenine-specific DNA methylase n=1 Tax=Dethiosulfatibacter aminovorans DSM 17477 TaxID=1121476 RepID=A0A1M6FBR8_9FIRM|nr:class I SAM-dependent RNA methyltransferase [Dethiosulfatibacter aminovorans]SHI95117.1 putative N6-adenine-specific DNA methylase [Dethiosulfatibacter aminovorans DSM 17477]
MLKVKLAAVCAFGLEAVVKRELLHMGYEDLRVDNGWIYFDGTLEDIVKTNINLRSAERILLVMGEFEAYTFTELHDHTFDLPWGDWITRDGKFTVNGKSLKSKLSSVPDCQSIVKKAIVNKLKEEYDQEWFSEKGAEFTVQVSLNKNKAVLTIDTTGSREGLFKRGYRKNAVEAPLKETMAAAMIQLSFWDKDRILYDPMCGSGTIAIEAALIGTNTAPGLYRTFAAEGWPIIPEDMWQDIRDHYESLVDEDVELQIYASDINSEAVKAARKNAARAGMEDHIKFECLDVKDVVLPGKYGVMITNPPYGDRIGDKETVERVSEDLGRIFGRDKTWSNYIITPFERFEKLYGAKASRKRKLFNGNVKVNYYQYYGERKPRD